MKKWWIIIILVVVAIFAIPMLAGFFRGVVVPFYKWGFSGQQSGEPAATPTPAATAVPAATSAPAATTTPVPAATETPAPAATPIVHSGLDYPSKSWVKLAAGSVVSGDVCVFDNDNNSKKTPIYDSKEGTADIIYFPEEIYIWAEWGCHVIEDANSPDIANLINDKVRDYSVRYFGNYTKLGDHKFVIYTNEIESAEIVINK